MKLLRDQGLIITRQGRGTFVASAVLGDEDEGGPGGPASDSAPGDNSKTI
jgi:hypothetical protein